MFHLKDNVVDLKKQTVDEGKTTDMYSWANAPRHPDSEFQEKTSGLETKVQISNLNLDHYHSNVSLLRDIKNLMLQRV